MAMQIIADKCTSCGDCEPLCPTASIYEKGTSFVIEKKTCTECEGDYDSPKCVQVCPIENCIIHLAS